MWARNRADCRPGPFRLQAVTAMLLHLCERGFGSTDEAVAALADSPVLTMPAVAARQCLQQLEEAALAVDGTLTEAGRAMLFESPYAAYAEALEAHRL